MNSPLPPLLAAVALAAPVLASAAPADRHPGVYQFRAIDPAVCASKQRESRVPQRERLQKLGDLPAAYVLRLDNPAPLREAFLAAAPNRLTYDPCATIERVR